MEKKILYNKKIIKKMLCILVDALDVEDANVILSRATGSEN